MTKEELEKEAEVFVSEKWTPYDFYDTECNVYNDDIKENLIETYIAGAELREKRISDLESTNKKISNEFHKLVDSFEKKQNENVELIGKVAFLEKYIAELEQQIEKMKKYLDCDCCEYQNDKDECHQCNYLEKTRWTLKKEIKEK